MLTTKALGVEAKCIIIEKCKHEGLKTSKLNKNLLNYNLKNMSACRFSKFTPWVGEIYLWGKLTPGLNSSVTLYRRLLSQDIELACYAKCLPLSGFLARAENDQQRARQSSSQSISSHLKRSPTSYSWWNQGPHSRKWKVCFIAIGYARKITE